MVVFGEGIGDQGLGIGDQRLEILVIFYLFHQQHILALALTLAPYRILFTNH